MSTLREELALERHALEEFERETVSHWQAGRYGLAQETKNEARLARLRVRELEQLEGEQ